MSTKYFSYMFHIDLDVFRNPFGQHFEVSHIANHYLPCRTDHTKTKCSKKQGGHVSYKKDFLSARRVPIFCNFQQWHGLNESRLTLALTGPSKRARSHVQMPLNGASSILDCLPVQKIPVFLDKSAISEENFKDYFLPDSFRLHQA